MSWSTDRRTLREVAYRNGELLADRAALYAARVPAFDLYSFVIDRLPAALAGPVVDVGCGPGWYMRRARQQGFAVVGCDLSIGMAAEAGGAGPALVADAQRLPMADGSAGAVLLAHMLYHVPDPGSALREARRVVSADGCVIVVTNTAAHLGAMRQLLRDGLAERDIAAAPSVESHFDDRVAARALPELFGRVGTEAVEGTIRLDRPEPAIAHLASTRTAYPSLSEGTWQAVLDSARRRIESAIAANGVWETATSSVVCVCRP